MMTISGSSMLTTPARARPKVWPAWLNINWAGYGSDGSGTDYYLLNGIAIGYPTDAAVNSFGAHRIGADEIVAKSNIIDQQEEVRKEAIYMANTRRGLAFPALVILVLLGLISAGTNSSASTLPSDPIDYGRLGVHSYYLTPFDQKVFAVTNLYNAVNEKNNEEFVLYAGGLRGGSSGVKLYQQKGKAQIYIGTYLYPGTKLLTAFEVGAFHEVGLADSRYSIFLAFNPMKHTFRQLKNFCSWETPRPPSYITMNRAQESFIKKYFLSTRATSLKIDPKMLNVKIFSNSIGWHECVNLPRLNSNDYTPNSDDTTSVSGWQGWVPLNATKAYLLNVTYKNSNKPNISGETKSFALVVIKGKDQMISTYGALGNQ
jgi:hypothetical protein